VEYNNKETLKEKNSSRLTKPESGLTVTKGKRTGQGGWEGRVRAERKKWEIRISMYNACVRRAMGGAVQHREDK